MEERSIAFQALHKDELVHEVRIRDVVPAEDVPSLRTQIRNLAKEIPSDSIVTFEGKVVEELLTVVKKLEELRELVKAAVRPKSLKNLTRIQALAHHLYHRLTRLEPESSTDRQTHSELTKDLDGILQKLDNMFSVFKTSVMPDVSSDSSPGVPLTSATPCKKYQMVSSLNLKYNGSSCVRVFLQRLEELCVSRGISEQLLHASAAELFDGEVLCWYRSVRSELNNWPELKQSLINEYLPYDFDRRLMQEIRTRTQGPNENIVTYVAIMLNYFSRLSYDVSEKDKFDIIFQNIRPEYSVPLCTTEITSLKQLKESCRMLEVGKHRVQTFVEPPKLSNGCLAPDLACKISAKPKIHAVVPAENKFCARCRVDSHRLSECTSTAIVCFRCGKHGFTARRCPHCNPTLPSTASPSSPQDNLPITKN